MWMWTFHGKFFGNCEIWKQRWKVWLEEIQNLSEFFYRWSEKQLPCTCTIREAYAASRRHFSSASFFRSGSNSFLTPSKTSIVASLAAITGFRAELGSWWSTPPTAPGTPFTRYSVVAAWTMFMAAPLRPCIQTGHKTHTRCTYYNLFFTGSLHGTQTSKELRHIQFSACQL